MQMQLYRLDVCKCIYFKKIEKAMKKIMTECFFFEIVEL